MMEAICHFVKSHEGIEHENVITIALESIENILIVGAEHLCQGERNPFADEFEEYGGLDWLEEMQSNDNISEEVYAKCVHIVTTYFELEGEEMSGGVLDYGLDAIENGKEEDGRFGFGLNSDTTKSGPYSF